MLRSDPTYLAHEYLDEHWDLPQFSEVAARMSEAKLGYVASATITENLHQYAVPQALRPLVARTDDPVLRETLCDFAANKRFRRDIYSRGTASTSRPNIGASCPRFASRSRCRATRHVRDRRPAGQANGQEALYAPIVDLLCRREAGFDELLALPPFGEARIDVLLDCLALLVHSAQVLPLVGPSAEAVPAQRFNRMMARHAREGRSYNHLATPVGRTGIRGDGVRPAHARGDP